MGGVILDTEAKRIFREGEDKLGALYVYLDDLGRADEYRAAILDPTLRDKLYAEMERN